MPAGASTAPIEQIIDDARNGRMFVLMDDVRSNSGDLVLAAQMVTPDAVNFMAAHGRGLICLALTEKRVKELALPMIARRNKDDDLDEFAVSIEAREGISTGISAADRAQTIAVAIDASRPRDAIVSPGHVFPVVARDGGVLIRAGHTEAAVDIARLAGLNPSAVICKILNDEGALASKQEIGALAKAYHLKVGTVRDLIEFRRRNDHLMERRAELNFRSKWGGEWKAITYGNKLNGEEIVAIIKGNIVPEQTTLVRMHTMSVFIDVFAEDCDRSGLLQRSMVRIAEEGRGIVILINKPVQNIATRFITLRRERKGLGTPELEALRDYGAGAQILTELGVQDIILLSNTKHSLVGLDGYGLSIVGQEKV